MSQPKWERIAQLGDVTPLDYGGYDVFRDTTGVYVEEAELLEVPAFDDEAETGTYYAYRVCLDRCTYVDGVLSDNKYHPELAAWFARDLSRVAECLGSDTASLRRDLCSEDAIARAHAYRAIGDYHGWENLCHDPLTLTRAEAETRLQGRES